MRLHDRLLAFALVAIACAADPAPAPAATTEGSSSAGSSSSGGVEPDPTTTSGVASSTTAVSSSSGESSGGDGSGSDASGDGDGSSSGGIVGDQFRVIDVTYTATFDNTSDSHYRVQVAEGTPPDWRAPIDFASGTAYVRLDVTDKPSDVPTIYNVCFEGAGAACMGYPPVYTAPGVIEFSYDFASFWNYDAVDWSQGVDQMALILKDENGNKQQGNPAFYPYTAHVTITIVPPGEAYMPPS